MQQVWLNETRVSFGTLADLHKAVGQHIIASGASDLLCTHNRHSGNCLSLWMAPHCLHAKVTVFHWLVCNAAEVGYTSVFGIARSRLRQVSAASLSGGYSIAEEDFGGAESGNLAEIRLL